MLVQVRTAPKNRSTHISDYQSTERESYERDENQLDDNSRVSSGALFLIIRNCPGLSFATKRIGPPCCTLFTFVTCCSLQILSQNYLLPLISVLAENTLLKTAYHFLLLLVGFDTLTYQKDYDRSPILVGHQRLKEICPRGNNKVIIYFLKS